jgi:hypothetical protein
MPNHHINSDLLTRADYVNRWTHPQVSAPGRELPSPKYTAGPSSASSVSLFWFSGTYGRFARFPCLILRWLRRRGAQGLGEGLDAAEPAIRQGQPGPWGVSAMPSTGRDSPRSTAAGRRAAWRQCGPCGRSDSRTPRAPSKRSLPARLGRQMIEPPRLELGLRTRRR